MPLDSIEHRFYLTSLTRKNLCRSIRLNFLFSLTKNKTACDRKSNTLYRVGKRILRKNFTRRKIDEYIDDRLFFSFINGQFTTFSNGDLLLCSTGLRT